MKKLSTAIALLLASGWASPPVAGMQNLGPLVVDPQHYHLEFENQYVKIIRCKIPPHDKVKMHHHPVGSVVVLVTDQNLKQTEADGKVGEAYRKAGAAFWADPVTHMGENISDKPYEYMSGLIPRQRPTSANNCALQDPRYLSGFSSGFAPSGSG